MIDRRRLLLHASAWLAAAPLAAAGAVPLEAAAFASPALGRPVPYLHYAAGSPGRGAPLVYLLHGHGGGEWDWVRAGGAVDVVEGLIAAGALPPLHLVLPGVGNSWYVDAPEPHGPVATALLDGLMPELEARLGADPARRGVVGLSMGGFGALHMGLRRPERFRCVAALSPAVFTADHAFSELQLRLFAGAFGEPFDPARYAAADPFTLVARAAASAAPPLVYLACGEEDFFGLEVGTQALGERLAAAGVPTVLQIKPGRHDWAFWRAELPLALAAFAGTIA